MSDHTFQAGKRHVRDVQGVTRDLTEKALYMCCQSYLAEVKASLLTQTIFNMKDSKQNLVREIDARRVSEEQLRAAAEEAREASAAAQEATRIKDKFVALVAHDLRSPLGAVQGLLELVLEEGDHPLSGDQRSLLDSAHESVKGLLEMIAKLLKISRLQTGKITVEKGFVALQPLVAGVVQRIEPLAAAKGIRLESRIPEGCRLFVDRYLFAEVVQNLLSNAIKFSHPGGVVEISVPREGTLAIRDQGVGIDPAVREKLFRVEEKSTTLGTRGERGTGFGLPFSHDIMQALGGELTVESEVGVGSTFSARVPVVTPRVLVVDDDPLQRSMIAILLEPVGVEVVEVENGREALGVLAGQPVHLVISDVLMPELDGFGLLERIRREQATALIPVLLITGDEAMETRDRAFALGADDYAVKPIVVNDFLPRVRRLIG